MAVMFSHHYRKILLISDFRKARVSRLTDYVLFLFLYSANFVSSLSKKSS